MTVHSHTRAEYERRLLEEAAGWPEHSRWLELTAATLHEIAAQRGVDFAMALLYDRLRRSAEQDRFIERIGKLSAAERWRPRMHATVVIAPGGFYVEFPHTGADG